MRLGMESSTTCSELVVGRDELHVCPSHGTRR